MNSNRTTRSWRLRRRPDGVINENDLELVTEEIPEISEGQILAKTIYFSLDGCDEDSEEKIIVSFITSSTVETTQKIFETRRSDSGCREIYTKKGCLFG